jgi:hypothetical protein
MKRRVLSCLATLLILGVLFLPNIAWGLPFTDYNNAEGDYYSSSTRIKCYYDDGTFDRTFKYVEILIFDQGDSYINDGEGEGAEVILARYWGDAEAEFIYCSGYIGSGNHPRFTLTGISDGEFGDYAEVSVVGRVYFDKYGTPKSISGTITGCIPSNTPPAPEHRYFKGNFRSKWHVFY